MQTDLIEKYAPTLCGATPPVVRDPRLRTSNGPEIWLTQTALGTDTLQTVGTYRQLPDESEYLSQP